MVVLAMDSFSEISLTVEPARMSAETAALLSNQDDIFLKIAGVFLFFQLLAERGDCGGNVYTKNTQPFNIKFS